jgi:hypothetical protein
MLMGRWSEMHDAIDMLIKRHRSSSIGGMIMYGRKARPERKCRTHIFFRSLTPS